MSLSNHNRVLKTGDHGHDVRPFSMESVDIPGNGNRSAQGTDKDSGPQIGENAYQKGLTDGIHTGRLQILGDIQTELKILRSVIEGIEKARAEIYEKIETDVVEMALAIAKKIIYEAAERERGIVVAAAQESIRKASDREMIKIKINPVDHGILNQKKSELLHCFDGIRSILFEEDDSIQPGGCLIETNQGDIDARLESQVRVIEGDIRKVTDSSRQG